MKVLLPLRESSAGVSFAVRVQPRASRTAISGMLGEGTALKVALAAPPVDGKANDALVRFFAEFFAVSRSSIEIMSGDQSRNKVVRVAGMNADRVREKLESVL